MAAHRTPPAPAAPRRVAVATMLIVAAAALALALAHIRRQHEMVRLGYELARETARLQRLEEENRRLRLERSMLRHPDRIERRALSLGMRRPAPAQIRVAPATGTTVAAQ
ncbi:MAG: hypothetical protein D6689_03520 [Deltaproteobacteria bacterium]|nr:MAG: hypothetical protein D6689_03520 [Deltaproteobacteria bacterium]